jgi:hypothetical protein
LFVLALGLLGFEGAARAVPIAIRCESATTWGTSWDGRYFMRSEILKEASAKRELGLEAASPAPAGCTWDLACVYDTEHDAVTEYLEGAHQVFKQRFGGRSGEGTKLDCPALIGTGSFHTPEEFQSQFGAKMEDASSIVRPRKDSEDKSAHAEVRTNGPGEWVLDGLLSGMVFTIAPPKQPGVAKTGAEAGPQTIELVVTKADRVYRFGKFTLDGPEAFITASFAKDGSKVVWRVDTFDNHQPKSYWTLWGKLTGPRIQVLVDARRKESWSPSALVAHGFVPQEIGQATDSHDHSTVYFATGQEATAKQISALIQGSDVKPLNGKADADVVVAIGVQ